MRFPAVILVAVLALSSSGSLVGSEERDWRVVAKWKGEGMKETETFQTTKREWRVKWKAYGEAFQGAGLLQIFVHDEEGNMLSLAANKTGTGSDVSYVRSSPGGHYLQISSANVQWEIEVQEKK